MCIRSRRSGAFSGSGRSDVEGDNRIDQSIKAAQDGRSCAQTSSKRPRRHVRPTVCMSYASWCFFTAHKETSGAALCLLFSFKNRARSRDAGRTRVTYPPQTHAHVPLPCALPPSVVQLTGTAPPSARLPPFSGPFPAVISPQSFAGGARVQVRRLGLGGLAGGALGHRVRDLARVRDADAERLAAVRVLLAQLVLARVEPFAPLPVRIRRGN